MIRSPVNLEVVQGLRDQRGAQLIVVHGRGSRRIPRIHLLIRHLTPDPPASVVIDIPQVDDVIGAFCVRAGASPGAIGA